MRYLTIQEIAAINTFVIQTYSPTEPIGIKEPNLLESAAFRPQSLAFGEDAYPTIFEKAVALFESVAQNHAFLNGNKRTALESLAIFLRYNGYHLEMGTQEKIEFTVNVATRRYSFSAIAQIIQEHAVAVE
jgi:death-on-curing protein